MDSVLFQEELFVPFLAIGEVANLDEALAETNRVDYGLTAGIFSAETSEIERFFNEVEAGVCYANKRSGATTGAWPERSRSAAGRDPGPPAKVAAGHTTSLSSCVNRAAL